LIYSSLLRMAKSTKRYKYKQFILNNDILNQNILKN